MGKGKGSILNKIGLLGTAGIMLFSFDILNQLGNPKINVSPTIVGISTGLITTSLLVNALRNRTYKINNRHYFHLYHLSQTSSQGRKVLKYPQ
ncbi:MAG: hypothetical protein U5N85_02015 [Arcicella sp.]|nr:hypothetical protein [Arcicella sp.]